MSQTMRHKLQRQGAASWHGRDVLSMPLQVPSRQKEVRAKPPVHIRFSQSTAAVAFVVRAQGSNLHMPSPRHVSLVSITGSGHQLAAPPHTPLLTSPVIQPFFPSRRHYNLQERQRFFEGAQVVLLQDIHHDRRHHAGARYEVRTAGSTTRAGGWRP